MKVKRSYRQLCPLAHALDLLGERWTLLVVRELLLGPRRFGELESNLPGVPVNLLAERLRRLEDRGVVARDGRRYELTEHGRGLEEPVLALARWGLHTLSPEPGTSFRPEWLALTLRATHRPSPGAPRSWELRVDGQPIGVGADGVRLGPADAPELVATLDAPTLLALGTGALEPAAAVEGGLVRLAGRPEDFAAALRTIALPLAA